MREREAVLSPPAGVLPPKILSPRRFLPENGSTGCPLERFLELPGVCGDLRFDPAVVS